MQTLTKILDLDTSYKLTGNSTEASIDTLGIAFGFGDSNDMYENATDYMFETVDYAKKSWLQADCEDFFRKTLDNETIEKFAADLSLYETALADYKTTVYNNEIVFEWIVRVINYKAYTVHDKNKTESEKRRTERERVALYKKQQKEKADMEKVAELLALKK